MIPKPLSEITWHDLVLLKEAEREEDDTLEFKESFVGGSDFTALNDNQRAKAVDGIAKEVIAFLNARGGDVLIGARERKNEHPLIEELTPVMNASATADRLAQSLSALIEPSQAIVQVRAILQQNDGAGAVVVRAPSSLRAPHRSARTKECYVRRGRESVPMAMDEIQDVTVRRSDLRRERNEVLESHFRDFATDLAGRVKLPARRFHIRAAIVPLAPQQLLLESPILAAANPDDPVVSRGSKDERLTVAFRSLTANWRPVLRGRRIEHVSEGGWREDDFQYASKELREDGTVIADFACFAALEGRQGVADGFYFEWITGFAANLLRSIEGLVELSPTLSNSVVRVGLNAVGDLTCISGDGMWAKAWDWPDGEVYLPDFLVPQPNEMNDALVQWQVDCASIAGYEYPVPFQFVAT